MTRKPTIQTGIDAQPSAGTYAEVDAAGLCGGQASETRGDGPSASLPQRPAGWIETLQAADLEAVRILSRTTHSTVGRLCAIGLSKLGNGWVYILLTALVFAHWGRAGYKVMLYAATNAAVTHCLYPMIKRRYCRRRPFIVDPELASLLATLDEHSFPSGHTMTLAAVLVPIVILWPALAIWAALMLLSLAWSRVATAHHYPSDVAAGAFLGLGLGYAISMTAIAAW